MASFLPTPSVVAFGTVRGQLEKVFDVVSSSRISDLRAFGHAILEEGVTLTPHRESDSGVGIQALETAFLLSFVSCILLWPWDRRPATACLEHLC